MRYAEAAQHRRLNSISCFDGGLVARVRGLLPVQSDAERVAAVFDALSDVTRLRIALALREGGEACVSDLCHIVGTPLSSVSQHLRRLREAMVIAKRRDGKMTYYSLSDPLVGDMLVRMLRG